MKASDTRVFESDDYLKFKVLEHEHDTECNEWDAECTLKLNEVVVSARQQFKWQSTAADATLKDNPFSEWLAPRTLALRPLYWEISSDATPDSKRGMRANTARHVSECADGKTSAKFEKSVRRGQDITSSLLVSSEKYTCEIVISY